MSKRTRVLIIIGIVFALFAGVGVATGAGSGAPFVGTRQPPGVSVQIAASGCRRGRLPDRHCTPGATFNVGAAHVCVSGYSKRVRSVPESEKRQVYAEYGIRSHSSGQYEVDHLIPLELGGSNSIRNLWPEAANPRPGFHEKDRLENTLHRLVCTERSLPLRKAQSQIATNWLAAFNTYRTNCAGPTGSRTVSQASLDACGLPSMNTTGPPAGTRRTSRGGFTASTPGAVYDGLNVSGSIRVAANNVTIENSNITDVDPSNAAIQIASGVTGTHVNYTSIHGTNTGQSGSLAFAVSYYGSSLTGVTMDHDNFYNGDRILNGYGTVTNSYCLGGAVFTSGGYLEHDECIYTSGSAPGIRAIHDTLLVDNGQTAAIFVDNPDYGGGGVDGTIDVEDSILAGGVYCIYGGAGTSSPHTGPATITNNRFSRIFYPNGGQYGTDWYFTHSVTTWSGNVWDDTDQPASG
jgi:hypothetical protein